MKILSLFDGMACGMIAMREAGITVDRYVAFEYDETSANAKKGRPFGFPALTASHNFPMIEQRGNVIGADFTEFKDFEFVLAGFPCTKFSIAQKKDRETKPYSGPGWDLFEEAWRAVCEAKPRFFVFENNKSMAKAVKEEISKIIGFEPICINSALVSAQNRQRLYWVGKRNADGTYSKVEIGQPEDREILLRDVLDDCCLAEKDKAYCLKHQAGNARDYFKKHHTNVKFEPVNVTSEGKSQTVKAQAQRNNEDNIIVYAGGTFGASGVAEPVRVGTYPNNAKNQDRHDSQQYRIYSTEGKSVALCGNGGGVGAKTGLYAIPVEFDGDIPIKAVSAADGKVYRVYKVENGLITIKDKQYPIKLADGYYIIRKLTVCECRRLQTIPDWYEFPVSDSQAYKMLGNGWTVQVIVHLINSTREDLYDRV